MQPAGEPSGTVTPLPSAFGHPPPRPAVIHLRSGPVPPNGEVQWSWYAMMDKHPGTDHLSYPDEHAASAAAEAWVKENFPGRPITYEGAK